MNTALLFDIDNTLTPPRMPINDVMADVLKRLRAPFHVVGGSHINLLRDQFFEPLYEFGFRGQFEAFLSLGGVHYHCDYSNGLEITTVSAFDMREHLGDEDFDTLTRILTETLRQPQFQLEAPVRVMGETLTYRGSMINFCPIGRDERNSPEYRANRDNFVTFDRERGYREKMTQHLKRELAALIKERELKIALGGQTSFDIGIATRDKAYSVRVLLGEGVERLVFMGDALFEGGNDYPIREFAESWPAGSRCPLEVIQVDGWEDTRRRLAELGFID